MIPFIFSSVKKASGWQGLFVGTMLLVFSSEVYAAVSTHTMADFTSVPISLIETAVSPQVLINASNDHQLFYKAYNDYSDLDGDGKPETTYKHLVDYYGYFDNHKCYNYDAGDKRFEPVAVTLNKYCTAADGNDAYWSGNFLNWASMTRIDTIRKILFGGHRRVDTSTDTVLERAFIPTDIHAFAKYYDGSDVNDLIPFTVNTSVQTGTSTTNRTIGIGSKDFDTNKSGSWIKIDDYVRIESSANSANYMEGWVTAFDSSDGNPLTVNVTQIGGSGTLANWNITNQTRKGITLCNVSYSATSGIFSQNVTEPPLIRVAAGNYTFWNTGEVHQCMWEEEDPGSNGSNYNKPIYSGIYAAQDNPKKADVGLGLYDYVARVQVCMDADKNGVLDLSSSTEKCKQYSYGNFKPIGLLQVYGDEDKLLFGMIAGTYGKATRGGEMVQKITNIDKMNGMCREINLGRDCNEDGDVLGGTDVDFVKQDDWVDATHNIGDGTFKRVYTSAGGPIGHATKSQGIINSWSLFRIYGYKYSDSKSPLWTYSVTSAGGDNCPLSINFFGDSSDSECHNWGNPFAEIYLSGLRYFAGENSPVDYQSGDGQFIEGINYNTGVWVDPLTTDNYCSRLNVVNFNSSIISADTIFTTDPAKMKDELDTSSFGVVKDLGSSKNSRELTEIIGRIEGIYDLNKKWFVGESGASQDRKCTAKTITNLGEVRGLCPDGPDLRGGFRIAGLAWYAHTNDIRGPAIGNRELEGIQKVDTYAVRLAAGHPVIEIPVPGSASKKVTLLPACIDNNKSDYGCTMVDFKIVKPHTVDDKGTADTSDDIGTGKFLVIWEDSLQGNDYDLDAGGTIEYTITSSNITINTAITLQNLGNSIGHGFVLSGTTEDGLHIFSGTNNFVYDDPLSGVTDCPATAKCNMTDLIRTDTFTLGTATAGLLEDPLWYAAKWGGFEDANDNYVPDLTKEWDRKINSTWESGSDGIPDNYFYASHPQQLEEALNRVFMTILERTSSGTAAAVVSNNVRGEGALYQAYYEPLKKDLDGLQASWIGTVHALWLDKYGYTRQDCRSTDSIATGECNPNGMLDNYLIDQVVQTFYDEAEDRTRTKVYTSDNADIFDPYFMEGVVTAYSAGSVTLEPYSMEGVVTDYNSLVMKVNPYSMTGTVTSYDPDTGAVTLSINTGSMQGTAGSSFANWQLYDQTSLLSGRSFTTMVLADTGSLSFVADPVGEWVAVGDVMSVSTYNLRGEANKTYDNWDIKCLSSGEVSTVSHGVTLANTGEIELTVADDLFSGCTEFKLSTFNMHGTAGNTYSDWTVANMTTGTDGTSTSSVTLVDSGVLNFSVLPAVAWVQVGDRLMLSNFQFIEKEIYDIGYLWNAREKLYLNGLTEAQLKSNRSFGDTADTGRHIKTWIDKDLDATIDSGEFVNFDESIFPAVSYGFFDVATENDAKNIVNYIRGVEVTGFRSRTVKYAVDDASPNVMRLGDIVNSTPTIVAAPQEAFNILYNDTSYTAFRRQYADRRAVAYVGGNDGLLHAFNSGFYGIVNDGGIDKVSYLVNGKNCATGGPAIAHPLGSEIWAYAPLNLLPHLKWLKDLSYSHVYYMDGKPRVFDAKIFAVDADHPNGWGTVMVVGMGFGGGAMTIDTAADGFKATPANDKTMRSAYVIFDITNPENEPRPLAEIQIPDGSFSSVYPAVMAFGDITTNQDKWFLVFGNGPNQLATASSITNAKAYVLNLDEFTTPGTTTVAPTGCSVVSVGNSAMKIISCDTGVGNSFMGSPTVVDWDLDYQADTAYFGLVGDATATSGRIMRMNLAENSTPSFWDKPATFALTNQPIVGKPSVGIDDLKNKWVYFGTGRYYVMADKTSTATQTLYGIKDVGDGVPVTRTTLINSTDIDVYNDANQTIENGPISTSTSTQITTFPDLVTEVDDFKKGWYLDLPPIVGEAGVAPATRALGQSALLGGILFTSVFQPSEDPCTGEGLSRLYGLYYKTGTAYPSPTIFGTETIVDGSTVRYRARSFVDLGRGLATSPSLHSGSGSGDNTISVFTQMSTGDVFRQPADTVESVRSGKTWWLEQ